MWCQLRKKSASEAKSIVEDWGTLTWLASAEIMIDLFSYCVDNNNQLCVL